MQNDSHPKTFDGGVEGHAVNSCHIDHVVRHAHEHDQGRSALSSPPKYKAAGIKPGPSDQLTKTPSADHDDGNLRSLAEPNHQPHAVSQGWQGIETAPKDGTRIIAVGWNWGIVGNDQHVTTVIWRLDREEWCESDDDDDDSACAYLTHWMPLPAPPSPAKTGGVE